VLGIGSTLGGLHAREPAVRLTVVGFAVAFVVLLGTRSLVGSGGVRVHSGALGGPHDGHIVERALIDTILDADGETVHIPNSALLGATISTLPGCDEESMVPTTHR
jgi:hypothetical protein